ncbi:MAG: hypothetical protein FJ026_08590, partial [Chloroflexi bacterium]|nr:hypothetical protein [Chloroflexota bacterium]
LELGLYAMLFAVALALRLLALDRWPLLDAEAGLALSAWRFARGLSASLRGHSPLLFHANALLFFLGNGSDAQARLWGVVFGSLLVLMPYGLRHRLGRWGALATAFLWALSPTAVYFSRAVDGHIVVAFCAVGILAALANYLERPHSGPLVAASGLLVLALLAAPSAYTIVAVLVTFPLFLRAWARFRDQEPLEELRQMVARASADRQAWRAASLLAAGLVLSLALAFGFNPGGWQMTLDQFGQWVAGFQLLGRSPWYQGFLLLLLYEGLPLLTGLLGLLVRRADNDVWTWLLRYWFFFTLLFSIVPGYRPPSSVLLMLVPLALLAGQAVQRLSEELERLVSEPRFWVLVALSLVMSAAAYLQLVTYLQVPLSNHLLRIVALTVFVVSSYALVWSLAGDEIPLRAGAVSLVLLLLLLWVRCEVSLNYQRARDPLEPLVGTTVSPDVLALTREAKVLSSHLEGDPRIMSWQVDERLETPLGWYLRDFEQIHYFSRIAATPQSRGVVTTETSPGPRGYVGLRFGLRLSRADTNWLAADWLRWWLGIRPSTVAQQVEKVLVWVRRAPV